MKWAIAKDETKSMANACDILRRLSESVTCPVCFLILDKPKSLPCGHTFCLDCILRVCEGVIGDEDDYYDDDYLNYNEEVDVNVSIALLTLVTCLSLYSAYSCGFMCISITIMAPRVGGWG